MLQKIYTNLTDENMYVYQWTYMKTGSADVSHFNESISLSSSKSYMRAEIGNVTEVNFIRK